MFMSYNDAGIANSLIYPNGDTLISNYDSKQTALAVFQFD